MKEAIVIGATRGIGKTIALRLAADGFKVYATGRNPEALNNGIIAEAANAGYTMIPLIFDMTDRDAVNRVYAQYFPDHAPDAVVYNAGTNADDLFAFMSPEAWDKVLHTNVDGFYNTVQPLIANMIARKNGRVVVISSVSGMTGQTGQVNYSASKAALIGAAKALAREVARKNVLVNVVAPGVIDTDMTKDLPKEHVLPLIPMRRYGVTEEIAGVVSFLCGPDSSYMTGQVLGVNGGMYI